MKEKRGLSDVVSNMLIILLTISAVIIVGNIVIPFVNRSLESTNCFEFRDHFKFDDSFGYNCYDDNARYVISVKAKGNASAVEGLSLRFLGEDISDTITIKDGLTLPNLKMLDESIGSGLIVPGNSYSALTYNYSSSQDYDRVEVYPIIAEDKLCDQSDSMRIVRC